MKKREKPSSKGKHADRGKSGLLEVSVSEVVDYLRITGVFGPALDAVVKRKLTAQAARKTGIVITDDELQQAADVFRHANNLKRASDMNAWLEANGITLDTFEKHLETNLLISKFLDRLETDIDKTSLLNSTLLKEIAREVIHQQWLDKTLSRFEWERMTT